MFVFHGGVAANLLFHAVNANSSADNVERLSEAEVLGQMTSVLLEGPRNFC